MLLWRGWLSRTQKQKGETKGCSVQFTSNWSLLQLFTDADQISLTRSVCCQVAAFQRDEKHHLHATKVSLKIRVLSKIDSTKRKFQVTSKRVCMAEKPAALNAVTAHWNPLQDAVDTWCVLWSIYEEIPFAEWSLLEWKRMFILRCWCREEAAQFHSETSWHLQCVKLENRLITVGHEQSCDLNAASFSLGNMVHS